MDVVRPSWPESSCASGRFPSSDVGSPRPAALAGSEEDADAAEAWLLPRSAEGVPPGSLLLLRGSGWSSP